MSARVYPDQQSARAACGEGEVVAAQVREYGDGRREVVGWGVIPALVEIDQGEGREPVRQPAGEFLAHWWSEIDNQAHRERE